MKRISLWILFALLLAFGSPVHSSAASVETAVSSETEAAAEDPTVLTAAPGMAGVSEIFALSDGSAELTPLSEAVAEHRIYRIAGLLSENGSLTCYENGEKITDSLITLDRLGSEATYWFDEEGNAFCDGYLRVRNEDGTVSHYYFQNDGRAFNRGLLYFLHSNEKKYLFYFGADGKALVDRVKTTGTASTAVYETCDPVTGSAAGTRRTYYFDEKGRGVRDGWHTIGSDTYYFQKNGVAATGKQTFGSIVASFNDDGILTHKIDTEKKMVALTYDDGPSVNTPTILDVLEKYDAVATFFVVGERVNPYSSYIKRAYEMDCEIGNHTYYHTFLTKVSEAEAEEAVESTNEAVKDLIGVSPVVMRPPGGLHNATVRSLVNMPLILWSIDTRDWEHRNADKTIETIKSEVGDGDVILMHDLYSATAEASKTIIPWLIEQGYQLVTVSELAEYRGGLNKGTVYEDFYP